MAVVAFLLGSIDALSFNFIHCYPFSSKPSMFIHVSFGPFGGSTVGLLLASSAALSAPGCSPPTCPQFSESSWVGESSTSNKSDEGPTWWEPNQAPDQKAPKASSVMKTLATPLALRYTSKSLAIFPYWQNFFSTFGEFGLWIGFGMPNSDLYCEGMFNYCSETRKCSLSKIKTSNKFPFTTVSKLNLRRSLIAVLEKHIGNTFKLR